MKLEFREIGCCDGGGDVFACDTDIGTYNIKRPTNEHNNVYHPDHDPITDPNDTRRAWSFDNGEDGFTSEPISNDVDVVVAACQTDYDARVAKIAEANGYVRVDAGQVVVNRDDLHSILFDANRINEFDFDALVLMRLQKALETKS